MIPFTDLDIRQEDVAAICDTVSSGWLTTGAKCRELELALAAAIGVAHAIVTSSLTSAVAPLLASLFPDALPRKAVFPTWTFTSVPMEFRHLGIEVELADVDPDTLMLPVRHYDSDLIVPTHLFGNEYDVAALKRANPGATIIDDAAHLAPGRRDLSAVAASLYSFYVTKPLPTGEGGAIAIHGDGALARRCLAARLHGIERGLPGAPLGRWLANAPYDVPMRGWKANMTDICAALGLSQLPRVEEGISRRRAIVERYGEALPALGIEPIAHQDGSSFHIAAVRLGAGWDREGLIADLARRGIGTSVHFTPLHRLSYWSDALFGVSPAQLIASAEAAVRYPVSEANAERILSLPLSGVMTDRQVEQVIAALSALAPGKSAKRERVRRVATNKGGRLRTPLPGMGLRIRPPVRPAP
jgi:dTDP-4-amino-4,6-dideoxygalactose transaminase